MRLGEEDLICVYEKMFHYRSIHKEGLQKPTVNGEKLDPFLLTSGTKKEFPLLLLIFNIILEVLSKNVYTLGRKVKKPCLFTDDMVFLCR